MSECFSGFRESLQKTTAQCGEQFKNKAFLHGKWEHICQICDHLSTKITQLLDCAVVVQWSLQVVNVSERRKYFPVGSVSVSLLRKPDTLTTRRLLNALVEVFYV